MKKIILISALVLSAVAAAATLIVSGERPSSAAAVPASTPAQVPAGKRTTLTLTYAEYDGVPLIRTEGQWKQLLSPQAFYVLRKEGTERAYTGALTDNKKKGTYHCAACGLVLFSSDAKYDSETGWPSFFQPAFKKNIVEKKDNLLGEERIETECARCGSHLGHVFDDGPEPTGLRYCMNSVALKFSLAK